MLNAFTGTIYVRVYNASGTLVGEGTMSAPWATRSGSVITVGELATFAVLTSGTPDASTWYLRFETAGGRWLRGPFGPAGSFTWSLASWQAGQGGTLGTVTFNAKGVTALAGAAFGASSGSATLAGSTTAAWLSTAPADLGTLTQGATISLTSYANIPFGSDPRFLIVTGPTGITVDELTGLLSISGSTAIASHTVVVSLSNGGVNPVNRTFSVTVQAASGWVLRTAANTGIVGAGISEASLTNQSGITYSAAQTVTGRRFTGGVTVSGSDVTIRGCLFDLAPGSAVIPLRNTGANLVLEDCTFRCPGGSVYMHVWMQGGSLTIRRCDISRGENNLTISAGSVTIEDSYLHDSSNASNPGGHRDCVEVYGGTNHVFRNSTLVHPGGETSVINIAPWSGSSFVSGLTVENCYLDGGGSGTVLKDLQSTGYIRYVRVMNCYFGGHTNDGSMYYQYWNLNDYERSSIVTTEAELQANPNAILWVGNTYLYTQNSPFGYYNQPTNRDGETAIAGVG